MMNKKHSLAFIMFISILLLTVSAVSANDTSSMKKADYNSPSSITSKKDDVNIKNINIESNINKEEINSNNKLENKTNENNLKNITKNNITTLKQEENLPEATKIIINTQWDNTDDSDGLSDNLTKYSVKLYQNDIILGLFTLTYDENWQDYAILDKYDLNGNEYNYDVEAYIKYLNKNGRITSSGSLSDWYNITITKTTTEYIQVIDDTPTKITEHSFLLSNKFINQTTDLNITAIWHDGNNAENKRPSTLEVGIYRNNILLQTVTLDESNNWNYKIRNLPRINLTNLATYTYTIKKITDIDDYHFTNTYTSLINDQSSETGFTTNIYAINSIYINVTSNIIWNDMDNQDGLRPNIVYAKLYANGKPFYWTDQMGVEVYFFQYRQTSGWNDMEYSLLKYEDNGNLINYSIDEISLPDYYSYSLIDNNPYDYTINASYLHKMNLTIHKTWNDDDNIEGIRPSNVTIEIYANMDDASILYDQTIILNNSNNWTYHVTGLPKYIDGKTVNYTFTEIVPENHNASYNMTHIEKNSKIPTVIHVDSYNVTYENNTYNSIFKVYVTNLSNNPVSMGKLIIQDINGQELYNKSFTMDDDELIFSLPLDSFNVSIQYEENEIYQQCNSTYDTNDIIHTWSMQGIHPWLMDDNTIAYCMNYTLPDPSSNLVSFNITGNPLYKINYTVWDSDIANITTMPYVRLTDDGNYELINRYTQENVMPYVRYLLYHQGNNDSYTINTALYVFLGQGPDVQWGARYNNPSSLWRLTQKCQNIINDVYHNVQNGNIVNPYDCIDVEDGNMTYQFFIYEPFNNGYQRLIGINYEHVANVDDYLLEISNTPIVTSLNITKVWNDSDNQDGIRPDYVYVQVNRDDKEYKIIKLSKQNNWTYTLNNLPKYDNGKIINYTIIETDVPTSYTSSINGTQIINTHIPENTTINVTKVWMDNDNNDGLRPESIEVNLLVSNQVIDTITIKEKDNWTGSFTGLPKYVDGKEIKYTIEEADVPTYYTATVNSTVITNTHIPEVISLNVTKIWDDKDNQDGIRPDNITITLLADGKVLTTAILSKDTEWKYTFDNLLKYSKGNQITYTIQETGIPSGYNVSTDNMTITNTHETYTKQINVTKLWDDANNNDGLRPENITVYLYADGNKIQEATITNDNQWKHTFTNLTEYHEGRLINYTISEVEIPGYTSNITVTPCGNFIITNTHENSLVELNISKVWDDANNNDGLRPDNITVEILANNQRHTTIIINSKDNWRYTVKDLPEYINATKVNYTIQEINIPKGYTSSINDTTITNTHIPEATMITVTKQWNDSLDNDGLRPDNVTVTLYADGKEIQTALLNLSNNWTYTFKGLTKYNNGTKIIYTVSESSISDKYEVTIKNCSNTFKIINTHIPEVTNLTVTKLWDDNDDNDGLRPAFITINLLADSKTIITKQITKEDNWKYTFTNLTKYANGKEILYTIEEISIPIGYTATIENMTITNTHEALTKNITVTKQWNDSDNNDNIRPENVTVKLFANGNNIKTINIHADDDWKYTFTDLPLYENGELITYGISEDTITDYNSKIVYCNDTFKIINTHQKYLTSLNITKVWIDDNNNDGLRPESITVLLLADGKITNTAIMTKDNNWKYTFDNLLKYNNTKEINYTVKEIVPDNYTVEYNQTQIINTHITKKINITVVKVWIDDDNDRLRPDNVTINLLADSNIIKTIILTQIDNWTYTFTNLDKYNNSREIIYTIDESDIPTGYDKSITGCNNQYIITNNHTIIYTNITVTKIWNDSDNNDNLRPDRIEVQLYANGEAIRKSIILCIENNWTYTYENLTKYDNGEVIDYYVQEVSLPEEYQVTYDKYTIINTHNKTTTQINVIKVWDDSNNNDGLRPKEITIQLYADGIKYGQAVKLNQQNNWGYSFNNLTKYNNGKLINYTVDEINTPLNYTKQVTQNNNTYTITNTHKQELINITVTKIWNDSDNNDNLRPDNVTILLYADDLIVNTITLPCNNKWTYTFEDLPRYNNQKEIIYKVDEENMTAGYIKEINGSSNNFTITNTHVIETTHVNVTKVWLDEDDKHNIRPADVTIVLYMDGEKTNTTKLNDENNWTYSFDNLLKYNKGKLINYTVDEIEVANYTKTLENNQNTWKITNTLNYTPLKFIWAWKLINYTECYNGNVSNDDGTVNSLNKPIIKNNIKTYSIKGFNKYHYNKRYASMKHFTRNINRHGSYQYRGCVLKYRLFIYLYKSYFFGNMTYSDFIAAMQQAGITIEQFNNWNNEGVITIDYDNIDGVPDSIELSNTKGDIPTSSDTIDKSGSSGHDGMMDSSNVEVEV